MKNFTLKNLSNEQKSFNDLKGEKLTLIDFWATWCKPCNKAIPELNKLYSRFKPQGVEIIGINCDGPRSISKVGPMVKSLQIQYPVLIDINTSLMNDLNLMAYPTLLLVDGEGKILWIHEGYVTGDADVISAEIEKHLKAM
ncbi:MAG: TlpA family protein disulfide reductase [Bacteroidales bacterium]|nr:TlpA family protein disulfide reductase [Bacteroidales bacterium]